MYTTSAHDVSCGRSCVETLGGRAAQQGTMNHTGGESFTGEEMPVWAKAVLGLLHTVTSINGILGSILILTALTTISYFRKVSACTYTIFLGNLVITDLYFQIYFFPLLAVSFAVGRYPVVNTGHCVVTAYLAMCCYTVFILTLTAISFDRYMRVCHDAIHRTRFSWRTSLLLCGLIWTVGILAPLPGALTDSLGFDTKTLVCFTKDSAKASVSLPYLVSFGFTLVASAFFNIKIFLVYRSVRCRIQQQCDPRVNGQSVRQKSVSASDIALLRSVLVIILCLVIFVTPGSVVRGLRSKMDINNVLYGFFLWMLSLGNSVDWIVYGLFNNRFRQGYKKIMARWNLPCQGKMEVPRGNSMDSEL
ncbi:hypothetical protein ACOMHN_029113 [Nucella lapillus]